MAPVVLSKRRMAAAFMLAGAADFLQICLFPFFGAGLASPLDVGVDIMVCAGLTWLLGWHYGFLPSFLLEAVPLLDLVPTWSLAVLLVVRSRKKAERTIDAQEPPLAASVPFAQPPLQPGRKPPPIIDI